MLIGYMSCICDHAYDSQPCEYKKLPKFLNQAHAGHRPACAWFLKIDPVRIVSMCVCVCVCVCPPPRLLITSGIMWNASYDWLNKFYSCYMAVVVIIVNGCGLGIDMCHSH